MSESFHRQALPGQPCGFCGTPQVEDSIVCPGCKWVDPPTRGRPDAPPMRPFGDTMICPHGRSAGEMCPHCLGINDVVRHEVTVEGHPDKTWNLPEGEFVLSCGCQIDVTETNAYGTKAFLVVPGPHLRPEPEFVNVEIIEDRYAQVLHKVTITYPEGMCPGDLQQALAAATSQWIRESQGESRSEWDRSRRSLADEIDGMVS